MLHPNLQRIAVIDLGSNTARLIVLQAVPGFAFRLEDEIREVVRLRQGMTLQGLSPEAIDRAFFTLRLFKTFCDSLKVDAIIPTATSAVREAANGPRFLAQVQREIGLELQLLDGEREAYYGALGALNETALRNGFIVDIGGGSMQLSQAEHQRYLCGASLPLGALALTERFIQSDPPGKREVRALEEEIQRSLDSIPWLGGQSGPLVGLGGSIRNLATIEQRRARYALDNLVGFELTAASVDQSIEEFLAQPLERRRRIGGLRADRADIILAGALVLRAVMQRLNTQVLTISTGGLREGLFYERFWRHLTYPVAPDVRSFGVLNLARVYDYQKAHANHVRFLVRRLYDQMRPLHGYGDAERELLDAAALLHDIGVTISYRDHDRHGEMLIASHGLPGHTPRETALVALLARYHRKGAPAPGEYAPLLLPEDDILLTRLASLLRLAEYLERGRNSNVDDVTVTWTNDELRITLIADTYPAVELWQSRRNAVELVTAAFGRAVTLDCTAAPAVHVSLDS